MKKLMPGQEVVILNAHRDGANMEGILVSRCKDKAYKDQWWVDFGFTKLPVGEERIVHVAEYRARERAKYTS